MAAARVPELVAHVVAASCAPATFGVVAIVAGSRMAMQCLVFLFGWIWIVFGGIGGDNGTAWAFAIAVILLRPVLLLTLALAASWATWRLVMRRLGWS